MAGSGGKGGGTVANPAMPAMQPNPVTGVMPRPYDRVPNPVTGVMPLPSAGPIPTGPGSVQAPAPAMAQPAQPGFNVNQAAAQGLGNAMDFTNQAMGGPLNVGAFNNPYQQQVIDNTAQDIERQRQMAINNLGAQAQGAGAYGGSRQGVAEGVTNAEYGRMAANQLGNMRMQGYNNALSSAMNDRSSRLGAASQLGGMANQAFNTGRTINQDMANQGLLQQSLQQALIDVARGDFANYAQSPMNSLNAPIAALGAARYPTSSSTTQNPGILGTLGALKYIMGPSAAAIPIG